MNRREALLTGAAAALIAAGPPSPAAAPGERPYKVAVMLGERSVVIDFAGPWEVFQDVMLGMPDHMRAPYELFTVGKTKEPVLLSGGMRVAPDYDIGSAPAADILLVPAQNSDPAMLAWLRSASATAEITFSVCTGAFQLGRAGLLDGLSATTHHESWDSFEKQFPKTRLRRGARFVDNGRIVTAAGLTSGIDAALHIVKRQLGESVAAQTALFMEYQGTQWRA
jgi:transcriptional regulator GlxA family with amidase domain